MTNKHFGWHKSWSLDQHGHLTHTSGLRVFLTCGKKRITLDVDRSSLAAFEAHEIERGVGSHQLDARLGRLTKEAHKLCRRELDTIFIPFVKRI
jgi:metal-dependent hydrolase (beta-lactamase superfamily II)